MTRIFIESKNDNTQEFNFLKAYLIHLGISLDKVDFVHEDGKDNIRLDRNKFLEAQAENKNNIILFDADKDGVTKTMLDKFLADNPDIQATYFLFPNNEEDGNVETLLDHILLKDNFQGFFGCFNDYEMCIKGQKDEAGNVLYSTPNLKGKLYTFFTSLHLPNSKMKEVKRGNWLFNEPGYWDFDSPFLDPLKVFLSGNICDIR
jgi:hypothetical protein